MELYKKIDDNIDVVDYPEHRRKPRDTQFNLVFEDEMKLYEQSDVISTITSKSELNSIEVKRKFEKLFSFHERRSQIKFDETK